MKRSSRTMQGVTLLEIMLVLAIAAMVIVMSIRYYQSASTNQKINGALDTITGIVAAGESYLSATGTFTSMPATAFDAYLPGGSSPTSPWGGVITYATAAANSYTITFNPAPPVDACARLTAMLLKNKNIVPNASCSTFTVTE
jgi:Tfp pilus assembly protein PilE